MGQLIDLVGQRFTRLVVLEKATREGDSRAYWRCKCDCGGIAVTSGRNLRQKVTRSCGCLGTEWSRSLGANESFIAKRAIKAMKHGNKRRSGMSPEYRTWLGMKRRCNDPNHKDYPTWGGRGIIVCSEWDASFETFLADMGPRPNERPQIDRIDPDGNYCPENCRWVSPSVQTSEHRRNLIAVSVGGIDFHSISAACRHFGVGRSLATYRIGKGIPLDQAVSIPAQSR